MLPGLVPSAHPRFASWLPPLRRTLLSLACAAACGAAAAADPAPVAATASLGATGGLTIPSADVLTTGDAAIAAGNYQDPHFGRFGRQRNTTLGFGLWPGVELFGRFADYTSPQHPRPGAKDGIGVRDISANLKWQFGQGGGGWPRLAVGATDLAGGALNFRAVYGVASDELGPVSWTLGLARGTRARQETGAPKVLDGLFGGVAVPVPGVPLQALAESDGTQRHLGLRYGTGPQAWLADGRLVATVQRSSGARDYFDRPADATAFTLQWVVPMGATDGQRQARMAPAAQARPLPPLPAPGAPDAAPLRDGAVALVAALRQAGLDRARVGLRNGTLVVVFENRSYLHNDADALGVALGLAAELAPAGTRQLQAVSLKAGLPVSATTVDVAAYRRFLRDGDGAAVRASLAVERGTAALDAAVDWRAGDAQAVAAPVRLELKPLLNYALGTELGAFDYSLAANLRVSTSPWRGALVYADWVQRLANSDNMDPGRPFAGQRQQNGLTTLALQQSLWLHPAIFASGGVGLYRHSYLGAEGEVTAWVPGRDDSVHLRGMGLRRHRDDAPLPSTQAFSGSYRWQWRPDTWVEGAVHRYTDGSTGPALTLTRWFGDVSLQLVARRGGSNTFAGIELGLPLTPRQATAAGPLLLSGTSRYVQTYRMRVVSRDTRGTILPSAVRPAELTLRSDVEWLNSGRLSIGDTSGQLQRLREAFFLFGRQALGDPGAGDRAGRSGP